MNNECNKQSRVNAALRRLWQERRRILHTTPTHWYAMMSVPQRVAWSAQITTDFSIIIQPDTCARAAEHVRDAICRCGSPTYFESVV